MANYKDFDINTSTTLKPWGAREEQVIKDIIDTLVVDTIDVTKNTSGHLHGKLYADDSISSIDSSTSDSITITMKDDESSGLVIENRTGSTIVEIDSSTVTPKATFNYDTDVVGKLYGDLYDLYDNPMIETRHESSNIYFTSDKTGGHDFNLDTSTYTFRIHDDSTELFRIHEPVATAEATFDIPVNINGSLDVDGDMNISDSNFTLASKEGGLLLQGDTPGDDNYTAAVIFGFSANAGKSGIVGKNFSADPDNMGLSFFTHYSATGSDNCEEVLTMKGSATASTYIGPAGDEDLIKLDPDSFEINGACIVNSSIQIDTIADAGTDVNKFLVHDGSNNIDYRTAAELLADLSGDAAGSFSWNSQNLTNVGDIGCANIDITSLTSGYFPYDNGTKLINSPMSVDGDGDISSSTLISAGSDNATDGSIIIGSRYASSKYINTLGTLYGSGGTYFGRQLKPDTGITNAFVSGATGSNIGGGAWCIGSYGESWYTQVPRQSLTEDVTPTTVRIPLYIKEDGYIGIGTDDPDDKLHVSGGNVQLDNNYEIRQKDSGGTARTIVSLTSSNVLNIGTSAGALAFIAGSGSYTERMRIDVNGNVGIGASPSGSYRLEVNSGTADSVALFESTDANAKIILKDSDSSQNIVTQNSLLSLGVNSSYAAFGGNLNIDASGNVSIGTTPSGSYNLEVSGDASVSGKLYGDLYDLYDNPMIETRHESSNIYFTSDKTGGHDFNLDTSTYTFRIHNDSTEFFRIHEPVATAEATFDIPVNINGSLDINAKWPISLGSDYDEDGVRTDNETKSAVVSSVHYDNEEENVCALYCWNDSSSSNINIGGGDANFNAVTKVRIVTAADNTTVAGTNQVVVESNHVYMYHLQGSTGENDLRYNTTTGELFYDTSALKYKNNVRNNPDTSWIYEIPVKIYDRIDGSKCNEIGIIAEDLETVAPAYCSYKNGEIESYNKSDLVPVLLSEIQKHEKEIMQLKQEIIELKKAA